MVDSVASPTQLMTLAQNAPPPPRTRAPSMRNLHVEQEVRQLRESDPVAAESMITLTGVWDDIPYKVIVCPPPSSTGGDNARVEGIVEEAFRQMDNTFNHFIPTSEVSLLNGERGAAFHPSRELQDVLRFSIMLNDLSDGLFDPTYGPLAKAWTHHLDERGEEPHASTLAPLAEHVGMKKIDFDGTRITKKDPEVTLDLCGVAKGWLVDHVVKRLRAGGYRDVYVDWGSEIRTLGRRVSGKPWVCGLEQPPALSSLFSQWQSEGRPRLTRAASNASVLDTVDENLPPLLATVPLENAALATSGDFRQCGRFGYFHVFHPHRQRPLQAGDDTIAMAAVMCDDCVTADALATVAVLWQTAEKAKGWLDNLSRDPIAVATGCVPRNYFLYTRSGDTLIQMKDTVRPKGNSLLIRPSGGPSSQFPTSPVRRRETREGDIRQAMRAVPQVVALVVLTPGDGGPPEVITASSVCPLFDLWSCDSGSTPTTPLSPVGAQRFAFNVQQGSAFHRVLTAEVGHTNTTLTTTTTTIPSPSTPVVVAIHLLDNRHDGLARLFAEDPRRAVGQTPMDFHQRLKGHCVSTLADYTYYCHMTHVRPVGDHAVCVVTVVEAPISTPCRNVLVTYQRAYAALAPLPSAAQHPPPIPGPHVVGVAMVVFRTAPEGASVQSLPAHYLTMCSFSPPMISIAFRTLPRPGVTHFTVYALRADARDSFRSSEDAERNSTATLHCTLELPSVTDGLIVGHVGRVVIAASSPPPLVMVAGVPWQLVSPGEVGSSSTLSPSLPGGAASWGADPTYDPTTRSAPLSGRSDHSVVGVGSVGEDHHHPSAWVGATDPTYSPWGGLDKRLPYL